MTNLYSFRLPPDRHLSILRFFYCLFPAALCLLLAACTSFSTTPVDSSTGHDSFNSDTPSINGMLYYLPRGVVHVVGANSTGTKSPDSTPSSPTGTNTAGTANPTISIHLSDSYTVTITTSIESDPDAYYYLQPVRNYVYDSAVDLKINPNGLLSTGTATSNDRTADIVSALSSIVTQVAAPALAPGPAAPKTVNELQARVEYYQTKYGTDFQISQAIITKLKTNLATDLKKVVAGFSDSDLDSPFTIAGGMPDKPMLSNLDTIAKNLVTKFSGALVPTAYAALDADLKSATTIPVYDNFDVVFDPEDAKSAITTIQNATHFKFSCFDHIPAGQTADFNNVGFKDDKQRNTSRDGIAFHPMKAWTLVFCPQDSATTKNIFYRATLILPDTKRTLMLRYDRMPFVQKSTNLGFSNGMLVEFNESVPSPILGFLGIPKSILSAILPIPTASATSGTTAAKK